MSRSFLDGALVASLALFLFLGTANAHQQSCKEWPLNIYELDYCKDRARFNAFKYETITKYEYLVVAEDGDGCTVWIERYNKEAKKFVRDREVTMDEHNQFAPANMKNKKRFIRFALIETPVKTKEDLADLYVLNVELAHFVPMTGCYLILEEVR